MLPLSLSMALTIKTGHLIGAENINEARFSAKAGLILGFIFACLTSLIIFTGREQIAALYTDDPVLISIAVQLLLFAAIYQWPDALQVCAIGSLRGYKITRQPLYIVLVAYWLIALPIGYTLGLTELWGEPMGAKGPWIGLVLGLSFAAVFLTGLLYKTSKNFI
jgi:MATE family multidrug resistance protein